MLFRRYSLRVVVIAITILLATSRGQMQHQSSDRQNALEVKADAYVSGSWNGMLFVIDDAAGFQVRIGARTEGGDYLSGDTANPFLTGIEDLFDESAKRKRGNHPSRTYAHFYESVTEVGPHAADGSYSRLAWNPLYPYDTGSRMQLEWVKLDEKSLLGKLTYLAPINYMSESRHTDVVLEAFSPLGFEARYNVDQGAAIGQAQYHRVLWWEDWNAWRFKFSSEELNASGENESGHRSGFQRPDYDDSNWAKVRWGAYWQEDPFINKSGYGWYRHQLVIPAGVKGQPLRFALGKISERDRTYLNGALIGELSGAQAERIYVIHPENPVYQTIQWGKTNVLAVQVHSSAALGGISSGPYGDSLRLKAVRLEPPPRPRVEAFETHRREVNFTLVSSRTADQTATFQDVKTLHSQMQQKWSLGSSSGDRAAGLLYLGLKTENFKGGRDNELYFMTKVDTKSTSAMLAESRAVLNGGNLAEIFTSARDRYESRRVSTSGGIAGAAEMTTNPLHWGVVYSREQKRSFVIDSRRWFIPEGWTLFGNSAVLTAWAAALEEKKLAQDTLRAILVERLPDGRVMNAVGKTITTPDRSEDMYAAYAAWKIYQKWGDLEFLGEVYPLIRNWHEWWFADRGDGQPWRDGNNDGLLELGSNLSPFNTPQPPRDSEEYGLHHQGAMWESGYDDNPMWGYYERGIAVHPSRFRGDPKVRYVSRAGTLNLNTTLTNSLYALSADMLVRIAHALEKPNDEARFKQQYERIKKRINDVLWDEKTGMYLNRIWPEEGGEFSYRKAPVMFYMMAAGIPSPEQARRLVYEHMLNPQEFWGEFVLPTISRDDPAFSEQYYWRGSIWPPMNYFAYEGLKRYGFDEVSAQLAEKTYRMVRRNWETTGAIWENYNSITGEGNPHGAGGSTRHYQWSTALPLLAIMECIDIEAWGDGLRFGSIGWREESSVSRWKTQEAEYDCRTGGAITELRRNGKLALSANAGIIVRNYKRDTQKISFNFKTRPESRDFLCLIGDLSPNSQIRATVRLDGNQIVSSTITDSRIAFSLPTGEHKVEILLTTER